MSVLQVSELSRLQGGIVLSSLRSKCMQLAQEAAAAQQPAMQYTLRGAAEPAIPRLMQVAICCQQRKLIDASKCSGAGYGAVHCLILYCLVQCACQRPYNASAGAHGTHLLVRTIILKQCTGAARPLSVLYT